MPPPPEPAERADGPGVHRFSRAVRWVHWAVGALMTVCILTAAVLYNSSLAVLVGNRHLVEQLHVYAGFALPLPLLAGLLARTYRGDLDRLNRFTTEDWQWLRTRTRRSGRLRVGKFNAGQKLNGALSGGAIAVLLMSGAVMFLPKVTSLGSRVGATFVHDWFSLALGLLVVGHLTYALRDAMAMQGMRTGYVSGRWARREHAAWAEEMGAGPALQDGGPDR